MATTEAIKSVDTDVRMKINPPSMFNVVLHNDDSTTIDFVIMILMQIFHKTLEEANDLTLQIHETGKGIAGTYSHEVATQKQAETTTCAQQNGFPLKCEVTEN
jgi:ATP-dependent Clp protease adaptor protein ClpS